MSEATPYLMDEDAAAAMDFLTRAFGFREVVRSLAPDEGRVWHAEMELDGARTSGSPAATSGVRGKAGERPSPSTSTSTTSTPTTSARGARAPRSGRSWTNRDYGDRRYHAVDSEGHVWIFATHLREGSREWQATLASQPSTE